MMIDVGIDLVEIPRMRKSLESPRFLHRVFTETEQAYITARHDPAESAAAYFAAKEAFSKAIGTGIKGFDLTDVEVRKTPENKPYLQLYGRAATLAGEKGLIFSLSLTHTKHYASAVVVAYSAAQD